MNKRILLTGLVVLCLLLAAGCAGKDKTNTDEQIGDEGVDTGTPETTEATASATGDMTEANASNTSGEVGSISREDLDKLKADLEDMEFDDVGGLSK
ncbi:hypothetical protein [Methanolobus sp. WCC4]|uniref:hypothetical protein n=1 Tax=Methanolobus sp. WCC4 TaxID=3125784 RepID=UPI0030F4C7EB